MEERGPATKRLLVIDDDPDFVELLGALLKKYPITIESCASGEEGLERAKSIEPHLILLDMFMPGIHGLTALTQLKGDAATVDIPVIITTNMKPGEVEMQAAESGADFISKAVPAREMAARIARALQL